MAHPPNYNHAGRKWASKQAVRSQIARRSRPHRNMRRNGRPSPFQVSIATGQPQRPLLQLNLLRKNRTAWDVHAPLSRSAVLPPTLDSNPVAGAVHQACSRSDVGKSLIAEEVGEVVSAVITQVKLSNNRWLMYRIPGFGSDHRALLRAAPTSTPFATRVVTHLPTAVMEVRNSRGTLTPLFYIYLLLL